MPQVREHRREVKRLHAYGVPLLGRVLLSLRWTVGCVQSALYRLKWRLIRSRSIAVIVVSKVFKSPLTKCGIDDSRQMSRKTWWRVRWELPASGAMVEGMPPPTAHSTGETSMAGLY